MDCDFKTTLAQKLMELSKDMSDHMLSEIVKIALE